MAAQMLVRKTVDKFFDGLGAKIKKAREADSRSLTVICAETGMSAANWYRIESEGVKALPLETLRSIERVLGVDLEVRIDD
jgi:transcriptional regulator with XRE-family HTH domain